MTIGQVDAVADLFTSALDNDAQVILGARVSEDLHDTIRVGPCSLEFGQVNPITRYHRPIRLRWQGHRVPSIRPLPRYPLSPHPGPLRQRNHR